ncbi:MAG: hypothetical protein JXR76_07350 [Deltaproteobacteria bacterium]|nr:hypothetical protein [Deltaproteobacteria bacterium]
MKHLYVWSAVLLVLAGCETLKKSDSRDKKADTGNDVASDSQSADTDTLTAIEKTRNITELQTIPPIQVEGNELAELASALEAKRLELEKRERDIIQREQMVTRLETEALNQKDELIRLQKETKTAINDAAGTIQNKYKEEYDKLLQRWENIKVKHKEFIVKYLKYSEAADKENLEAEIRRLKKEREQRIAQLLKTIEGMNPQSCAMMMTSMDAADAVEVLSGLSNTKSAEILSNMAPQKAAELAKGLMGPEVPTVPSLDDVPLPAPPEGSIKETKKKRKTNKKAQKTNKNASQDNPENGGAK